MKAAGGGRADGWGESSSRGGDARGGEGGRGSRSGQQEAQRQQKEQQRRADAPTLLPLCRCCVNLFKLRRSVKEIANGTYRHEMP